MIELSDVSFAYGGRQVLEKAGLSLPDGCVTALIGPNGAGKSTALRLMAGLLRPQAGRVRVDGRNPAGIARREAARLIAYLPQERPVPALSVEGLAAHGRFAYQNAAGRLGASDREAIDRALVLAGMDGHRDRDLRTLSGGQRQKAYLAMVIAQDTRNLLLDEPFAHLDIGFQLELCRLLARLAREGRCVGVVLHDLALAPRLCERVALLHEGRERFTGSPEECFRSRAFEAAFGVRVSESRGIVFE